LRLLGAVGALRAALGLPLFPQWRVSFAPAIARARAALGAAAAAAAEAEGRAMTLEHAVAYALEPPAAPAPGAGRAAPPEAPAPAGLTGREAQVLRLVAAGLTDAAVAARLLVSPRTVHPHLRTISSKLGVASRSAAT